MPSNIMTMAFIQTPLFLLVTDPVQNQLYMPLKQTGGGCVGVLSSERLGARLPGDSKATSCTEKGTSAKLPAMLSDTPRSSLDHVAPVFASVAKLLHRDGHDQDEYRQGDERPDQDISREQYGFHEISLYRTQSHCGQP